MSYLRREWYGFKLWWVLVRGWRWPKLPWTSYPPSEGRAVFPMEIGWGTSEYRGASEDVAVQDEESG